MRLLTSTLLALLLASTVFAQEVLVSIEAEAQFSDGGLFGLAVEILDDVDGDGIDDVLAGAPTLDVGGLLNVGRVTLHSGHDGTVIYTIDGDDQSDGFGTNLATLGDVNGDGIADFAVGSPSEVTSPISQPGSVRVHSGADGTLLWAAFGVHNSDLGESLAAVGDVNGDGTPDVIAGAPSYATAQSNAGRTTIYSGDDGTILNLITGLGGQRCGRSVASAGGDLTGDGLPDVLIGYGGTALEQGSVRVHNGLQQLWFHRINGTDVGAAIGQGVAGLGDIDGDGVTDIAFRQGTHDFGTVRVLSGADYSTITTHTPPAGASFFGHITVSAGDWNLDGTPDLFIGAPGNIGGNSTPGQVFVVPATGGPPIATITGDPSSRIFGYSLAAGGNFDGNELPDLVVGAPRKQTTVGFPSVRLFAGPHPRPGSGDDLELRTSVAGAPSRTFPVIDVTGGNLLEVALRSPESGYQFTIPILVAQLTPTGTPLPQPAGFPEIWINPSPFAPDPVLVLYDGSTGAFAPQVLPPEGLDLAFVIPAGLTGQSIVLQALALAPSTETGNPIFTATDATEIRVN